MSAAQGLCREPRARYQFSSGGGGSSRSACHCRSQVQGGMNHSDAGWRPGDQAASPLMATAAFGEEKLSSGPVIATLSISGGSSSWVGPGVSPPEPSWLDPRPPQEPGACKVFHLRGKKSKDEPQEPSVCECVCV